MIRGRASHRTSATAALAALTLAMAACGDEPQSDATVPAESPEDAPMAVAGVGFATPESVLHDAAADVYLVSNINGAPLDKDGNGFVSRLSPDGTVLALKWIDGAADGVTLNAPKGMAIADGVLYVADIDCVRMFDAASGTPEGEVCPEGATFLNDVAPAPGGGVLVTDSGLDSTFSPAGSDALYHVAGGQAVPVIRDPGLGAPNGVASGGAGVWMVTFMSGQIYQVTGEDQAAELMAVDGAQFDGIEMLDDGRVLISNWATSCVHVLATDGSLACTFPDLEAPADIGVDRQRGRVLVPLFNANEVRIIPLG